jgi:hypothetical protein
MAGFFRKLPLKIVEWPGYNSLNEAREFSGEGMVGHIPYGAFVALAGMFCAGQRRAGPSSPGFTRSTSG